MNYDRFFLVLICLFLAQFNSQGFSGLIQVYCHNCPVCTASKVERFQASGTVRPRLYGALTRVESPTRPEVEYMRKERAESVLTDIQFGRQLSVQKEPSLEQQLSFELDNQLSAWTLL